MQNAPTITVIGCGYVGVTTAAILAHCGFTVHAVEINPERLEVLKTGRSFFYEAGIDPLIKAGVDNGTLSFTDSYDEAIHPDSVVFSCVGTPDNPDGSSNLSYVFAVAEETAKRINGNSIFVQKSTVPVGTGVRVERIFTDANKTIGYVSNPEFLREGTAVIDTLWFDRVVTGSDNPKGAAAIIDIYKQVEANRGAIAKLAGLEPPTNVPQSQYVTVSRNSAELIKVSANAFLALKISFANSIAKLADKADANVVEVMDAVGSDRRIGRAFLNAGRGYGGGCFPKDVIGLIRSADEYGVEMEIMDAAQNLNESMPHYIIGKATAALGGELDSKRFAVLGLSFKNGTSDTRHSPAITIANTLVGAGCKVNAYDPQAMHEAKPQLSDQIVLMNSTDEAIKDVDCVFVATDWPEFVTLTDEQLALVPVLVDCMNCIDPTRLPKSTTYIGVGR